MKNSRHIQRDGKNQNDSFGQSMIDSDRINTTIEMILMRLD